MLPSRRAVLLGGLGLVAAGCATPGPAAPPPSADDPQLAALEDRFGGRLGVFAVDTGSGTTVTHRADERFLMCSTSKMLAAAAILALRVDRPGLLDQQVSYPRSALVTYSPETERHDAMTVRDLCHAAMTLSDNTAMNLLLETLGGPERLTGFLRREGDMISRQDRPETDLNILDGDKDTSTPAQVAANLRSFALDDGLDPGGRDLLVGWLKANTTGATRIKAGLPADWVVGDKTGAGGQGEINDVAVVWPPGRAPLVMAVYTAPADPGSNGSPETVAEAARIAASLLVSGE
ncbi:class A beta-lactamase [Pseudonocardia oroxyli]|uniref:Beta-lactamase n=1 Tax=Pseudonocardia oroxyli TaxID=366584 RepID=A0A1G7G479_PSEOR|nr:class A beta-lactamase [Pseudonocardia oroxyli]SDE82954.1 beta-lactamase class A [Pseudonocardia oroxyli]